MQGILETGTIGATDSRLLNDVSEVEYGLKATLKALSQALRSTTSDHVLRGLSDQALRRASETQINIASFRDTRDLLSQWRSYGRGEGVALGLDTTRLHNPIQLGVA